MDKEQPSFKSTIEIGGNRQEEDFAFTAALQKLLKDEYFLLRTESEHKNTFEKRMQTTLFAYYRSTVNLGESVHQTIQLEKSRMDRSVSNLGSSLQSERSDKSLKYEDEKKLLEDEGFGDVYTFVNQVVLSLAKDPYLMMILIGKHQHSANPEGLSSLAKVIVSCMYENIVDDEVFHKDVLKIIVFCVKKLVEDKKHYFEINLMEKDFIQLLLAEVAERGDAKQYAKIIARNTILEIAKLDHAVDFKVGEEDDDLLKSTMKLEHKESKHHENPSKLNANQPKPEDRRSRVRLYSNGLRVQDEKLRKGSILRRKYRNCIGEELLQQLGINEQILFPCFSSRESRQTRLEQQINRQLGRMLSKGQSKLQSSLSNDITLIRNIVLVFFNDVFKMLYSMPAIIRISSRILYKYLNKKFNNKNCLYVVADFVINFWLLSSLNIDLSVLQASKLSPYLQRNVEQVSKVIKGIVKDNYKDIHPAFSKQFNQLGSNLRVSITNYIVEVINIDSASIDALCDEVEGYFEGREEKPQEPKNIKSYCVCINMVDLKRLIDMVRGAEKELSVVNDKLWKRVLRIDMMSEGKELFGDKREKMTGKLYKASKAYALFTDLSLPGHLSIDYHKTYTNAFKNNKAKNLLRQVLLSLNDLQTYQQFHTSNALEDFFESLQFGGEDDSLYTYDKIPLKLRLEYLQILSRKFKLIDVVRQLREETEIRFTGFKSTWQKSKECYLRAITSINFQNNRLSIKENYIRDQIKRRKLQEFFAKHEIKLCLTSPKTREKEIVLKTNLMKEVIEQYKERLWLQNQSKCIHTALNLDFIKSLTGQPEKAKVRYESHINSIMKFSEILCSLPEVKERFNTVDDNIGIKEVFFDFIQYIRDLIRAHESDYAILLQNQDWLQQNIELKISKKLYDKLYPKHPLYDDIALHLRLKTLDWLTFDHLRIDPALRNWKVWEVAAAHLRQIDKLRTAAQKLHCIQETVKIIFNSYSLMSKSQKPASADDIYPLVILVLIRAAPKRLISSISFIDSFASPSKLLSKEGYCFTQIKSAIQFCDNLSPDNITLCEDRAANHIEFSRRIYEKEIEYGVYFMLGRRKDSPKSEQMRMEYLREYFNRK